MKRMPVLLRQFNWRYFLVRLLVSALALVITTALIPDIYFKDFRVVTILIVVLGMSILNAVVKPIIQFLTLSLLFATYGLVVAFINGVLLYLLSVFFPERYAVTSFFWAIVGGIVLGLLGTFFESLLGLTVPIVPEDRTELRKQISGQTVSIGQLLVKARAERGQGLMGEELTTVLATGGVAQQIAANTRLPDETEASPPPADAGEPDEAATAADATAIAVVDGAAEAVPGADEDEAASSMAFKIATPADEQEASA